MRTSPSEAVGLMFKGMGLRDMTWFTEVVPEEEAHKHVSRIYAESKKTTKRIGIGNILIGWGK